MLVRAAAHHLKRLLLRAGPVDHSIVHLRAHGNIILVSDVKSGRHMTGIYTGFTSVGRPRQ